MYRQGDILLVQVSKIPPRHYQVTDNVLARGEVTGHAHRIQHGIVVRTNNTGTLFVVAQNDTTLIHDEHGPIVIAPGKYQVIRQREFNPSPEGGPMWKLVLD
jgi:hypothetical protein